MNEASFLKKNQEKWLRFEGIVERKSTTTPDELAELFTQVTDDLAYAQTFFPKSKTQVYLNQLSAGAHELIYKNKREDRSRLWSFWTDEVPEVFGRHFRQMLYAAAFFGIGMLIGWFSSINDETFIRLILSDRYVNLTEENIAKGDPMGIYGMDGQFSMFLYFLYNNGSLCLRVFAAGLLFSFLSIYILFINGIMLGTFLTMFFQAGLGIVATSTVFMHGTVEIFAAVMSGAAGLTMGNSFLFPGSYTRMDSLKRGAKDGLKMVLAVMPLIVLAAFIESTITRHYDVSLVLNFAIVGLSCIFIIWYFIYKPYTTLKKNESATPSH